jgi:uncharacterized alkaline shock family protein YloU
MNGPAESPGEAPEAPLADRVAEAVEGCPDVASLNRGTVATYLSGRAVPGVVVHDTDVEVSVVAVYGRPLAEIADEVRSAVEPLAPGRTVNVHIDDITMPDIDAAGPGEQSSTVEGERNG